MQFVDEESPEYEDNLTGDNPFLTQNAKPSTEEVEKYTAQWLEEADEEEDQKDESEDSDAGEGLTSTALPTLEFVVHEREAPAEDTGEEIHPESPYLTRTSHSSSIRVSVPPPVPSAFPEADPLKELDQAVKAYEAGMSARADVSSGNFQTSRLDLDPDDSDFPPTCVPAFESPTSSKSSDKDPFEREVDLIEEEMDSAAEPSEEMIQRASIRLQIPLEKPRDEAHAKKKEAKARVSVRPSIHAPQPAIVRPQGVLLAEEMRNVRSFLTTALHPDLRLQCVVTRNRSGFKRFFPVYTLTLENNSAFLLAAKKRPNNKTSNYLISMSESDLKKNSAFYLGKLRSNFLGTEYSMFDSGMNPKRKKANPGNTREQLGTVFYVGCR